MNDKTKKQFAMYILGMRDLPEYTPKHIARAAKASKNLFECLNDKTKTLEEVFKALEEKHLAARDLHMAEGVVWLW